LVPLSAQVAINVRRRKADWDAVGAVQDGVVMNLEALAARYGDFAGAASGQSACFEQWATEVSGDQDVLRWLADLPEDKQQPNLVFAAARWHGVPAPGAYQALRDALINDKGAIRSTIMKRSTQTNEVGRLATLMPAFATVASERQPLALLEVGASAGLCLYPDRYDYDWRPVGRLTGSGGPELRCDVTGPMPLPIAPLDVRWRGGIDLSPLDLTDDDAVAWLSILDAADFVHRSGAPHAVDHGLLGRSSLWRWGVGSGRAVSMTRHCCWVISWSRAACIGCWLSTVTCCSVTGTSRTCSSARRWDGRRCRPGWSRR
jgi:hypothetical protein